MFSFKKKEEAPQSAGRREFIRQSAAVLSGLVLGADLLAQSQERGSELPVFIREAIDVLPDGYQISPDQVVAVNDLKTIAPSFSDSRLKEIPAVFVVDGKFPIVIVMDPKGNTAILDLQEQYEREKKEKNLGALYQMAGMILHEVVHARGITSERSAMQVEISFLEQLVKEGKLTGDRGAPYIEKLKALVNSKEFIEGQQILRP